MGKKTDQVWHDAGWPQSRINQMLGGWPPSRFPEDYVHVANVQANGLREAVEMTTGTGSILEGNAIPWERNPGVQSLASILTHRDSDKGDVIVDPQGRAYRVEHQGFSEISVAKEKKTALGELFKEWQEDYAAAKREDAHWYGKESLGELLADKSPPEPEQGKQPDQQTIRQMLDNVEAVTKSRFYEDPDPIASPVEMFRMPDGKQGGEPFTALSAREKLQVLDYYTDWQDFEQRGVSFDQMDRVFHNVIAGKPRETWLEGAGLTALAREDRVSEAEKLSRILSKPSPTQEQKVGQQEKQKDRGIER